MKYPLIFSSILLVLSLYISSCSKPTETKEEFIQKGIIMSDTLLKSVDNQLKDAELSVDSAIKSGAFVPPPPPNNTTTPGTTANPNNSPQSMSK